MKNICYNEDKKILKRRAKCNEYYANHREDILKRMKRNWENNPNNRKFHPNKLSLSKLGDKNPMWKGDNVGYHALHRWIISRKPKPELCEECHERKTYDLANISGKYLRNITDWQWLCRKCHMLSDGRFKNLKQFQEVN